MDTSAQALPVQGLSGQSRRGQNSWLGAQHSNGPRASSTGQSSWPAWASTEAVKCSVTISWKHELRWVQEQGAGALEWDRADQALPANSPQSVVQSYLEGVQTGVWQLTRALEAVQGTREALSQAHHLLQGLSQTSQTLAPLREHVVQHKQLQVLTQLLPRLQAGECGGGGSLGSASKSPQIPTLSSSWGTREVITGEMHLGHPRE